MNKSEALMAALLFAALSWLAWVGLKRAWLGWRERRVLAAKYGDLEMFSRRLEEWGVPRSKRSNEESAR